MASIIGGVTGILMVMACAGPADPNRSVCCSVDELVELANSGVDEHVLLDTIRNNGVEIKLTAFDVAALSEAGVSRGVIDAIGGGPCECATAAPVPMPVDPAPLDEAPPPVDEPTPSDGPIDKEDPVDEPYPTDAPVTLIFDLQYAGGKSFKLLNESGEPCVDAVVTMNGVYQWKHRQIERGSTKFLRLSKLVDPATGATGEGQMLRTLDVSCAAGTWSTEL